MLYTKIYEKIKTEQMTDDVGKSELKVLIYSCVRLTCNASVVLWIN